MSIWRPHTTGILIGGVLLIVIAAAVAFMMTAFQPTTDVRLGGGAFNLRIAKDESSRVKGLSGVESLNPNEGLLIVFESDDEWGIWMKDMKIPIDILWLDKDKKVIYMVKNAGPELSTDKTFKPNDDARYVIELLAGSVEENSIKIGEIAVFTLEGEGK